MINKINKKKLKKVINSLMIIGMFVLLFSVSRPAFAVASGVCFGSGSPSAISMIGCFIEWIPIQNDVLVTLLCFQNT